MRNLRANIRTFSEPITFTSYTESIVDGVPVKTAGEQYKTYANVTANNFLSTKQTYHTSNPEAEIKISIRRPRSYDIVPQNTEVLIRNKEYVVAAIDEFSVNSEYYFVFASAKKGAI